jgi:16S rRNA (cytidine1402-2'-O)-methyltransferase
MSKQKKGNLYLIPTPLAENSLDKLLTIELQKIIKSIDLFLVENVRTTRRFISSLKLDIEIDRLKFSVLDKNTSDEKISRLCSPLIKGLDMGVLSEAGCPGIADPGNLAVSFAHKHDVRVVPLVGPSSIFMALMSSGLNGQNFTFHGYLPIDKQKRIQRIRELENRVKKDRQTQIFMETPYRNVQLLADLLQVCKPYTRLCIASDITGADEMIATRSVGEWKKLAIELHKTPAIFLIG